MFVWRWREKNAVFNIKPFGNLNGDVKMWLFQEAGCGLWKHVPFAQRSCTTSSRRMISLQNSPKGFLWGNINRVHRRELPWVTAAYIRSSRQSGRNTTLVSFDTADFTGLLLWITGLTLYTEIRSPKHYVRRAVNHLNAVATWHKLNPEPKWTLILSWQVLYFAGGLHHNVRVLSFTSGTLKF